MTKISAISMVLLLIGGCATDHGRGSPQYGSSSTLVLAKDLQQLPGGGFYLGVSGYTFVAGKMHFPSGKQRIAFACPGKWEWRYLTDYVPSIEYDFQAGSEYELYCEKGYPQIRFFVAG